MEIPKLSKCRIHNFSTYSDIVFSQHLEEFPHYVEAGEGICINCECKIKNMLVPIKSYGESYRPLCDNCKQKLNEALETIDKKGKEVYPEWHKHSASAK